MNDKVRATSFLRRGLSGLLTVAMLGAGTALAQTAEGTGKTEISVEAESGEMLGSAHVSAKGNTVIGFNRAGDGVSVTVTVPEAGPYDVTVYASSLGGSKTNTVCANGMNVGDIVNKSAETTAEVVPYVWLDEGENVISVVSSWGYIAVDRFTITPSAPLPADLYDVEPTLSNPNATDETKRLMTYLCDQYGKSILSGQQCQEGPFGLENASIWRATGGQYAAVLGMDFISDSPARKEKGDNSSHVVEYAIEHWEKGGIVAMCWHWCPDNRYTKPGKDSWGTFYTENTNFNLKKVMNGQDPEGYQGLLDDIDAIAAQLKRLQDAGVPVLWRPLHEASGGWFWWGASGPEPYLQLYHLLYDRLTNVHGLNNLIWVWNGGDAAWYPGDEYVDIIGEDIYPGEKVYTTQAARFLRAVSYTPTRKLIALTENGCIPDPERMAREGIMWSFWCTWSGDFVLKTPGFNAYSDQYTEKTQLKKTYKDERVIDRKHLPNLKNYPLRSE